MHIAAMRIIAYVLTLSVLITCAVGAPIKFESLKVGSTVFKDVTVISFTATDVYFKHSAGVASAKLRRLQPEAQKALGYDARAAGELELQRIEADQAYGSTVQSAPPVSSPAGAGARKRDSSATHLADAISEKSLLGKPAPAVDFKRWEDLGEPPSGKHVLLVFWTSWSIPSIQNLTAMTALQKRFAEQLVVLGLDPEPGGEREVKPDFPSAADPGGRLAEACGATSVPFALLINPEGTVVYQGHPAALNQARLGELLSKTGSSSR